MKPKTPKPTMPAAERTVRVLYDYLQKVANAAPQVANATTKASGAR